MCIQDGDNMGDKIRRFINKPLHFPNAKSRWGIIIFITLWVFLILYTLQPFGLNFAEHKLIITSLITLAVFFMCFIPIQGLPLLFKNHFSAATWNNGKFFLLCFILITAFAVVDAFLLSKYFDNIEGPIYYTDFSVYRRFFVYYKACIFVAVFPIFIIYISLARGKIEKKSQTHTTTSPAEMEEDNSEPIELAGYTKDSVKVVPEDILYAKVSGNYVAVYYLKNGKVEYKLLRISLNQLYDSLQEYPYIIRCHRAFIVNTLKLEKVRGNLKGYNLELKDTEVKIPVSKSYTRIVKEKTIHLQS